MTQGYIFFDAEYMYIVPYYDFIDLTAERGEVHYAIITPATNLSLCNQVNDYLSNSTGNSVSVEWILWAYWYNVCSIDDNICNNTEVNAIYMHNSVKFFCSLIIFRL